MMKSCVVLVEAPSSYFESLPTDCAWSILASTKESDMSTPNEQTPDLSILDTMPHISQDTEDAKKAVQRRIAKLEAEAEQENDEINPKLQEEYTFKFDWKDGRGKRWGGEFTNRIASVMDRQTIGALQAQWQLGMSHVSIDPEIAGMNYVVAHMAITLKPGRGAEWAKDIRKLTDTDLVQALYGEVASHEATFHGRAGDQEIGKEDR